MKGPEPPVAVVADDKLYEAAITQDQELVQSAAICWDTQDQYMYCVCNHPVQRMCVLSVCLVLSVQTLDGVR